MVFRQQMSGALGALALAGLLIGCGDATAPQNYSDAPLQTDRPVYQLQADKRGDLRVDIPFTYHNGTGEAVYLVNCMSLVPPTLQKWHDGEWVTAWDAVLPRCLSPPIRVAPDAIYEDTLRVFAGRRGSNLHPQFQIPDLGGTYRLVWHMPVHDYDFDDPPSGTPLALDDRVSNTFELRAP